MTIQKTSRTATSALAVAGLALVLAGCGSDDDAPEVVEPQAQDESEPDTDEATEAAPLTDDAEETEDTDAGVETGDTDETEETDGGTVQAGSEVDKTEFLNRLKAPGNDVLGSFQFEMTMDAEGQAMGMTGQADLRGDSPAMEATMEIPDLGTMQMILVDEAMYIAMPGMTGEGEYMQMGIDELGMGGENPLSSIDMESTWDAWDEGATSVQLVGTEQIDGESMERYTVNVDTEVALEATGESPVAGMPDTIAYDVWVDENDLMRKMAFDMAGVAMDMTVNNWGEDVDIQAPDPSNIVEMPGG